MIRNLSMKIGEVDSGSARLLAMHSNLIHLDAVVGGEICYLSIILIVYLRHY